MNEALKIPALASGVRWLWVAAVIVVADQLSKLWIQGSMELYETIEVLPVLNIYHTFNPGAAWSFLAHADGWQRWLFSILAIGVSIGLIVWLRRLALASHALLISGLVLIVGGAIGNLIDRLRFGHVVDFLDFHAMGAHWPAFNVADSGITVGAVLLILEGFVNHERRAGAAS
jgi:signal peptidase II